MYIGEMESGQIQPMNRNKDTLVVNQDVMVGLITAMNGVLCLLGRCFSVKFCKELKAEVLEREFFKSNTKHI